MAVTSTNLDYLLPLFRLEIGDLDSASYRYTDEWLQTALAAAVTSLEKWWTFKYTITYSNNYQTATCARNTSDWVFRDADPPIIQNLDSRPVILMAAILLLGGQLENFSWNIGSWRDAEISYSNISSGKLKEFSLDLKMAELMGYLTPPNKRLRPSLKGETPGFKKNRHESRFDY